MELIAPGDAEALAAMHQTTVEDPWNAPAFAALLASPGVFGFRLGEHGFILCRAAAGEAEVLTLAVRPEHRGAGLATTLLASALGWAEAMACEAVFLEVAEDNVPALALYRSAGFESVGRRPAYYARAAGATDALVMRRDLNR